MSRFFRRPSPSMVVSIVALVLALGGGAYAAGTIGTSDIKKGAVTRSKLHSNAVTSSKVKNHSLLRKDFKNGQLPRGARGPRGFRGATGPRGPAGASALSTVPSGQTIHGAVGGDFHAFDATASDFGVDV